MKWLMSWMSNTGQISKKAFIYGAKRLQVTKQVSLSKSCEFFGISRQAVYQAEQRAEKKAATLELIKKMVFEERRHLPRLGTRKVYLRLKDKLIARGIKLGRNGLFDFLREHKMLIRPKKNYTKTTFSKHWIRKHPNLFSSMELTRSEQAFVSDITYVESKEGTHYTFHLLRTLILGK